MRTRTATLLLIGMSLFAGISQWVAQEQAGACALDGVSVRPIFSVDISWDNRPMETFCSIRCAITYLKHCEAPRAIEVRDEVTGDIIAATRAHFVKSRVISVPSAANDIHAFRDRLHALAHVEKYDGEMIRNPFRSDSRPKSP